MCKNVNEIGGRGRCNESSGDSAPRPGTLPRLQHFLNSVHPRGTHGLGSPADKAPTVFGSMDSRGGTRVSF